MMTSPLLLGLQGVPEPAMTTGGWVFMAVAWMTVGTLLVWSFVRVMSGPKPGENG